MALASCQMDNELFSIYDMYYPNAFVTNSGAVLSSAASTDSLLYSSDCEVSVMGGVESASLEIVGYGHCWEEGSKIPVIKKDSSNCIIIKSYLDSGDKFRTLITDLKCETIYSIRSFVILSDGTIGYNPDTLRIRTQMPHDKWFDSGDLDINGKVMAGRADGVSITTKTDDGDIVTYFGMGRNSSNTFGDFYKYSAKDHQYTQLASISEKNRPNFGLWGAVGFYVDHTDEKHINYRRIYVGAGSMRVDPKVSEDYNTDFFVYDPAKGTWGRVTYIHPNNPDQVSPPPFSPRTGAVAFSFGGYGFIGLGEFNNNGVVSYQNDFYRFIMYTDRSGYAYPDRGYFEQMSEHFDLGFRSGCSVVNCGDNTSYILGGIGKGLADNDRIYRDIIRCVFTPPSYGSPDSYKFDWKVWGQFPDEFESRGFGMAFVIDNVIYYGGGEGYTNKVSGDRQRFYSDFMKFDLATRTASLCAPYKNGLESDDGVGPEISRAFVIPDVDRAYVGGGMEPSNNVYSNSVWVYRP